MSDSILRHNEETLAKLANKAPPEESCDEILSLKLAQATHIIRELTSGKTLSPTERLKVMQYFENDTMFARMLLVQFIED